MANRKDLSLSEKYKLLKKFDALPKCHQREAASRLGISQPTLCRLLQQRSKIIDQALSFNTNRKRQRNGKAKEVEAALLAWFKIEQFKNAPVTRAILALKAKEISKKFGIKNFNPTDGWLTRWKIRNNIVYKRHKDVKCEQIKNSSSTLLFGYSANQIYNIGETALYYRALPNHVFILKNDSHFGDKKLMDRITVLLACNMNGTIKKQPFVIGKWKNPHCLKGITSLPVEYTNNSEACMTSKIFSNYMKKWDKELGKEKIAVLLANCTVHPKLELNNIKLIHLPSNSTSFIQPLNQGIIKTFKAYYRRDIRVKIIEAFDNPSKSARDITKSINLLDTFHMIVKAWKNVSPLSIFNCFKKTGFDKLNHLIVELNINNLQQQEDPSIDEFYKEFSNWVDIDENVPTSANQIEDIVLSKKNKEITEEAADEKELENDMPAPPTIHESYQALEIIRRTLEQRGASIDDYNSFYDIETRVAKLIKATTKQSTIHMFFQ